MREYWAIGATEAWKFVLRNGKYAAEEIKGDLDPQRGASRGFTLDLKARAGGGIELDDGGDGSDELCTLAALSS